MKNPISQSSKQGFTLVETVIAIGILAILLTGFAVVFGPAAASVRKSIDVEKADRLATSLESAMGTLTAADSQDYATGFDKGIAWIKGSNNEKTAILVYQYRGYISRLRSDGTLEQVNKDDDLSKLIPGQDYMVVTAARKIDDSLFGKDLEAIEGSVFLVRCTQLVMNGNTMQKGTAGTVTNADQLAAIPYTAMFYRLDGKNEAYFSGKPFKEAFTKSSSTNTKPQFVRNLAVRR